MRFDHCGKELQKDKTCPCQSPEAKLPRPSFPLWVIPGTVCAVIAFGYVALKIAGYNYFLWVHVVWLASAIAFFNLLMREIKHNRHTFKVIGIIILIVLILAIASRALLYSESDIYDKEYVFVSDIVEGFFLTDPIYVGKLVYDYQNFIWYGPLLGRTADFRIFQYL